MENFNGQLFDITAGLLSCVVSTIVTFQFFDARYQRVYQKKVLYIAVNCLVCLMNSAIFFIKLPILNMCFWILVILLAGRLLYYDEKANKFKYYLLNLSFLFAYSLCEAAGGILVELGIKVLNIKQNETVISFVCTISSSVSVILLYYLLLRRLILKDKQRNISVTQYIIYVIISMYVLINIGGILFLMQHELTSRDYLFLLLDAVLVIVINLCLFYILEIFAKNKEMKYKLAVYESQAKSNYEYYEKQLENNKKMMTAIHDIRKYIRGMEELKQSGVSSQLQEYTDSFEKMLEALIVEDVEKSQQNVSQTEQKG